MLQGNEKAQNNKYEQLGKVKKKFSMGTKTKIGNIYREQKHI